MLFCHDFCRMLSFRLPNVFVWSMATWCNMLILQIRHVPPLNFHGNLEIFTQQKSPAFFHLRELHQDAFCCELFGIQLSSTPALPVEHQRLVIRKGQRYLPDVERLNGTWNVMLVGTRNWWCATHPKQQPLWILWMPLDFLEKCNKVWGYPRPTNSRKCRFTGGPS